MAYPFFTDDFQPHLCRARSAETLFTKVNKVKLEAESSQVVIVIDGFKPEYLTGLQASIVIKPLF